MEEQEKKRFTKQTCKKLLIISLITSGIIFTIDLIVSFMPILNIGVYTSDNAWATLIGSINKIENETFYETTRLFLLGVVICGNALLVGVFFAGKMLAFLMELKSLTLPDEEYLENLKNKKGTHNLKKETKYNFVINIVFYLILFAVEVVFTEYARNYYRIVSSFVLISVLLTAVFMLAIVIMDFFKNICI